MAFPFASPGDPDYVDTPDSPAATPAKQPVAARPQPGPRGPAPERSAPPAARPAPSVSPRAVRPFSTTKLVPKSASATTLLQLARTKVARTWGEYLLGNGVSSAFDPNQRGMAVDMAAYSNPISGTIFGVNDMARHLYNGNYGNAAGALGMTALSFLPGAGAAGALTRGGMAAAKGVGTAAAKGGIKALAAPAATTAANTAAKGFMGQAGSMVGQGLKATGKAVGKGLQAVHQPFVNAVAPGSLASRLADPRNATNAMSSFGRHTGLQAADNLAMGTQKAVQYGANAMQNNKMLRYPAMAGGYLAHNHGLNPTGEGQSDINARLDDERERMIGQLDHLQY